MTCENGGTCQNLINDFMCYCADGFTGVTCETSKCLYTRSQKIVLCIIYCNFVRFCLDVDDCVSNTCQNGGMCVDGVASFTCDCAPGFTDRNCSTSEKKYSMRSINLEFIDLLFPQTLTNVLGSCVSMVEPVWTELTQDLVIVRSVTRATSAA